jgi:hypothetical protein
MICCFGSTLDNPTLLDLMDSRRYRGAHRTSRYVDAHARPQKAALQRRLIPAPSQLGY